MTHSTAKARHDHRITLLRYIVGEFDANLPQDLNEEEVLHRAIDLACQHTYSIGPGLAALIAPDEHNEGVACSQHATPDAVH